MLLKLSKVLPTSRIGILKIRLFELYSKKKKQSLRFFGVTKGAVSQSNKHKRFLTGYKIKSYITQTKQSGLRIDSSSLIFFKNKTCIKHRKLKKHKKNYGLIQKTISHRRFLFKFPRVV